MKIKFSILILGFLIFTSDHYSFSQTLEAEIPTGLKPYRSMLYTGLINEDKNILMVNLMNFDEPARHANYYIINLETLELMCNIHVKRWTYLMDAYFYQNKYLYISYGMGYFETKYWIFDIFSGLLVDKVKGKESPKGDDYRSGKLEFKNATVKKNDGKIILENFIVSFENTTSTIQIFSK